MIAEDDLYNRYVILRRTAKRPRSVAMALIGCYFIIETASSLAASIRQVRGNQFFSRLAGRVSAIVRIVAFPSWSRTP